MNKILQQNTHKVSSPLIAYCQNIRKSKRSRVFHLYCNPPSSPDRMLVYHRVDTVTDMGTFFCKHGYTDPHVNTKY